MKRFHFALEPVRRWRREQAELEELELRKLYSQLQAIEAERQSIEAARLAAEQILQDPNIGSEDLVNLESFRFHSRNRLRQAEEKRKQAETKIHEQRNKVVEAKRQFELLERLKQKRVAEWRAAQDKEQEELAAELYLAKRQRENRSSKSQQTLDSF